METHGYLRTTQTQTIEDTRSPGRIGSKKSTLKLGGGWKWDPAEAARVAAEERRAEQAAASGVAASEAAQRRNVKNKSTQGQEIRPSASKSTERIDAGWLSEAARTNPREQNTRGPVLRSWRAEPLAGPHDPRALERRRLGASGFDPSDVPLARNLEHEAGTHGNKGASRLSANTWGKDADYADKQPKDARAILQTRINGGHASPATWDPISHGFVGTDAMRIQPDSTGYRSVGPGGTTAQGEARERANVE